MRYPLNGPGGSGAAETCEPCQVREEAAVSGKFWAPPVSLSGLFFFKRKGCGINRSLYSVREMDRSLFKQFQPGGLVIVLGANEIDVDGHITMNFNGITDELGVECWQGG